MLVLVPFSGEGEHGRGAGAGAEGKSAVRGCWCWCRCCSGWRNALNWKNALFVRHGRQQHVNGKSTDERITCAPRWREGGAGEGGREG